MLVLVLVLLLLLLLLLLLDSYFIFRCVRWSTPQGGEVREHGVRKQYQMAVDVQY